MKEYNLAELEEKKEKDLIKIAGEFGLDGDEVKKLSKHNLVFKTLEAQAKKNGLLFSEGVLECLDDGFGFLRAPEFSYLPSQDDIYVSLSRARSSIPPKGPDDNDQPSDHEVYVSLGEITNVDNHLGKRRESLPKAREHLLKHGDDENHNNGHHEYADY